jgi:hypothetical protein
LTSTCEHQYNHHENLKNREEFRMRIRNWLLAMGFVFVIASSSWGVPRAINVQGRLTGFSPGNSIDFDIYDAESGGSLIWNGAVRTIVTGPIGGAAELSVDSNGIFNVMLGTIPDSSPMPEFLEEIYYLQITVAGTPLVPRQRLVATPFAITARNVRGGTVVAQSATWHGVRGESRGTGLSSGVTGANLSTAADAGPGVSGLSGTVGVAGASSKVGVAGFGAGNLGVLTGLERVGVYGHGQILGVLGTSGENFGVAGAGPKIGLVGYGGVASLGVPTVERVGVYGSGVTAGGYFVSSDSDGYGVHARNTVIGGYALRVEGGIETGVQRVSVPGGIVPVTAVFNGVAGIIEIPAGADYREIDVVSPYLDSNDTLVLVTSQSGDNYGTVVTDKNPIASTFTLERRPSRSFGEGEIGFLIIN